MTNPLVGRIVTGIKIASDKMSLLFITNQGELVVGTDADCCSHTWIEHVELPSLGFPCTVSSVTDLDLPGSTDDGELKVYGCNILTDKGEIVIDYRNASNGYYGGNLVWPGGYHYGGVFGQNNSDHEWEEIHVG